jgi:hypothetical protein
MAIQIIKNPYISGIKKFRCNPIFKTPPKLVEELLQHHSLHQSVSLL